MYIEVVVVVSLAVVLHATHLDDIDSSYANVQVSAHAATNNLDEQEHSPSLDDNVDYYAHPKYEYSYGVDDPHSRDQKFQQESRDGDVVKGYYRVAEADGTIRTVHYTSDKQNGFSVVVERAGHTQVYGKESNSVDDN